MRSRLSLPAPAKLLVLFLLLTGVPLVALGWLAWRVLQQDRAIETQRSHERLENAATLIARDLDQRLDAWEALAAERRAGSGPAALPAGTVLLIIDSHGLVERSGVPLPYYPEVPASPQPSPALFDAGESQEFREQNLTKAADAYRGLAASQDSAVRAMALVRLARVLRKERRLDEALAVYDELMRLGAVMVAGSPSELVARRERLSLLKSRGDDQSAGREAAQLHAALVEGRYVVDRATFEYFSDPLGSKSPANDQSSTASVQLAEAVGHLWAERIAQPHGRAAWSGPGAAFIAVWRPISSGTALIVGRLDGLIASSAALADGLQVKFTLDAPDGQGSSATASNPPAQLTKSLREMGLPWTIAVSLANPAASAEVASSRRNLFVAGFVLMALVIGAASYIVARAVNRELGVARLQSEFVAAVSHEFRTPLTAMCHLTEMLEEGVASPDRLPDYYGALGRESRRLHAMVENLLDFGRLQAGRRTYMFEHEDARTFVSTVVDDFRERASASGRRVELDTPADAGQPRVDIRADREALALALRNLLDNAVKYSPVASLVTTRVERTNGSVRIHVSDDGPGISKDEQRLIFRKFIRGAAARRSDVKGTGIGLTMADEIVKAHGGRLELASEVGNGSTFTIVLPAPDGP
jgi:two-component system phosphate regulon sensor histidine kinase PhoR